MPRISSETLETRYDGAQLRPILPCDDESYDLVASLIQEDTIEREARLDKLAEDPHAAMVAEFAAMHAMYKDRVVEVLHETGEREIRFATRSWEEGYERKGKKVDAGYRLDDVYSATFLNNGSIRYTIVTMNVADMGYKYSFTDDRIENVQVQLDGFNGHALATLAPINYPRATKHLLERTIATAQIVNQRREKYPQTAHYADLHAKSMLEAMTPSSVSS
jgi:hypothetical protein